MDETPPSNRKSKRLWTAAVIGLLLMAVGFAVFALLTDGAAPVRPVDPLVGVWKRTDSTTTNTHALVLSSNGRMRITTSDPKGTLLQNVTGSWQEKNGQFFWHEDGEGVVARVARQLSYIRGVHDEQSMPIISVTETELRLGDPSRPFIYVKQ